MYQEMLQKQQRKEINMKKLRVGINGFGRIGRIASRIMLERKDLELTAINSRADAGSHAYLLKYDSTYGTLPYDIKVNDGNLSVNGKKVFVFAAREPYEIPWREAQVDVVIDATGKFRKVEDLKGHLKAGARKVVLSAPAKDDMKTLVMGINQNTYNTKTDDVVSNSSCTTNCLSTTLKVLHDNFSVVGGFMTTTHAVTDSQNLLDNSHKKEVRLRRASYASMIPASTGSAKDIGKLYPELAGKLLCQSIRVPIQTVSLIQLTVEVKKSASKETVNDAYLKAEKSYLNGILEVAKEQLVSKDFTGNPHSAILDPFLTQVLGEKLVQVSAWYDNEWGYTSRLVDMVEFVGKK
jgi:glyceraldehyde 3-phosphate dehydrogenase